MPGLFGSGKQIDKGISNFVEFLTSTTLAFSGKVSNFFVTTDSLLRSRNYEWLLAIEADCIIVAASLNCSFIFSLFFVKRQQFKIHEPRQYIHTLERKQYPRMKTNLLERSRPNCSTSETSQFRIVC